MTDPALSDDDNLSEWTKSIAAGGSTVCVPKFCFTHWTARVTVVSALIAKYVEVLKTLETIRDSSTGDARADSSSYIRLKEDSQFIIVLTVAQFVLSFLHSVTVALQKVDCNLADAYINVTIAKECIRDTRNEWSWESIWTRATQMANEIDITIQKPRSVIRQVYRSNAGGISQRS